MISVDDFAAECESWLISRCQRRTPHGAPSANVAPERLDLFEEIDVEQLDAELASVRGWRRALGDAGLAWITGSVNDGGRGLTSAHERAFADAARLFDVPSNRVLMVSLGMVAPTIVDHGGDEARARYVRALYAGELIACQLFSEPGAGSDLGSAATRAVRDGDGWRITGQKVWTSGAHFSDIGEVLCRTAPGSGRDAFTMFMVDMHARGVTVRPLRQMTGGAAFNEVFLDDVWAPDSDRLGEVGEGWRVMLTTLGHERRSIGGQGYGGVGLLSPQRYIDLAEAYGRSRDPVVRQHLAQLVTYLRLSKWNSQRGLGFGNSSATIEGSRSSAASALHPGGVGRTRHRSPDRSRADALGDRCPVLPESQNGGMRSTVPWACPGSRSSSPQRWCCLGCRRLMRCRG